MRVVQQRSAREAAFASIPLAVIDAALCWWISFKTVDVCVCSDIVWFGITNQHVDSSAMCVLQLLQKICLVNNVKTLDFSYQFVLSGNRADK